MAIKTPAACVAIENQLKIKRAELTRLNNNRPTGGNGPVGKPGQNRDPEWEAMKKKVQAEVNSLEKKLTACFVQHTANIPVTVRFEKLYCDDQDDLEKFWPDVEDDEPYLLVYALNLPPTIPTNLLTYRPDARMFKIGPFHSVDSDETVWGSGRVWDTNGNPQRIDNGDNVVMLVAMMEEDDSLADRVRTHAETLMLAEVAKAAPALATDRNAFRARLIEGMRGAVMTAARIGIPSQDDLIGQIQDLRLSKPLLDKARREGSAPVTLNFSSSSARYSATFRVELAA